MEFRIAGRERITVPAGTFDCFRIEATRNQPAPRAARTWMIIITRWHDPERVRPAIAASEEIRRMTVNGHVKTMHSGPPGARVVRSTLSSRTMRRFAAPSRPSPQ